MADSVADDKKRKHDDANTTVDDATKKKTRSDDNNNEEEAITSSMATHALAEDVSEEGPTIGPTPRKRRELQFEKLYLDQLPSAQMFERSYMHRDVVSHTLVTSLTSFLITCSVDGHVKFWKKMPAGLGIEFVKHFRAHTARITGVSSSADGQMLCTVSEDKQMKVFDIVNFDMINMISLGYTPSICELIHPRGAARAIVAVGEKDSGVIRLYDPRATTPNKGILEPLLTISTLHRAPLTVMKYNWNYDVVISADKKGMIEYWSPPIEDIDLAAANTPIVDFQDTVVKLDKSNNNNDNGATASATAATTDVAPAAAAPRTTTITTTALSLCLPSPFATTLTTST
eukprot:GEZU01019990.1.p1 GENE.GEZU01019990.1~~GEZU01019990.1.p1  ORF type:complete len:344 (+),score=111.02 GEZU01019990.1:1094-2125(+)